MIFASYEYLLLFLPITFLLLFVFSRLGGRTIGALFLCGASIYFYIQWKLDDLLILTTSAVFNFSIGRILVSEVLNSLQRHVVLVFGIVGNLVALAYYKYWEFLISNVDWLIGSASAKSVHLLPLGISFFTFTQIAFLVDTYRRQAREPSAVNYFLFVSFFPHLIAGPIIHHKEMMPQFADSSTYKPNPSFISLGLWFLTIGAFKKIVLADSIAPWADYAFAQAHAGIIPDLQVAWSGALAYTFQLYFDFSGYSDMAIGSAAIFGIWLPLNFNSPYKAVNITDFWRRWHMTLSRFLRDYLYIPLGGNRFGEPRRYVNLTITMLLGGLWHGAAWTFVLWGALHGFYLIVDHLWRSFSVRRGWREMPAAVSWPATFLLVVAAWVMFRASDLATALRFYQGMAGLGAKPAAGGLVQIPHLGFVSLLLPDANPNAIAFAWDVVLATIALFTPNSQQLVERVLLAVRSGSRPRAVLMAVGAGTAAALAVGSISATKIFIYFNF